MFFANVSLIRQWILKRLRLYSDDNNEFNVDAEEGKITLEDRAISHVLFDMRGTNMVDLSGLHMLEALAQELATYTPDPENGKIHPVDIYFGNVKHEVNEVFKAAHLIEGMYKGGGDKALPAPSSPE